MDVRVGLWRKLSTEQLMLLNCGVGEDSWESLGLQGDQTSQPKGNQYWIFIGRTDAEAESPVLWPPDAKTWLFRKHPDAGNDGRQEEKGMTADEMVGWHHGWLNEHEFEQAPGVCDGQGSLACYSPWGYKELNMTEWLNWTDICIVQTLRSTKGYKWYVVSLLSWKISLLFLVNNCLFLLVPCKSLQLLAQGVYVCIYVYMHACMHACICMCVFLHMFIYIILPLWLKCNQTVHCSSHCLILYFWDCF